MVDLCDEVLYNVVYKIYARMENEEMFKVAAIFSDNMVLQRNKKIAVFGQGVDGNVVKAVINYNEVGEARCNEAQCQVVDGKWMLYLPEMKENTGCTMVVTDGEAKKEFKNIAIGEVWLCGGQSNMEFELQNIIGGEDYLKNDNPNVRFYYTQKKAYIDDEFYQTEEESCWEEFDGEKAKRWSGIGYLYGKQLSEQLGVTVGLVGCNWGGTSASAWMSEEYLASDEDTNTYLAGYRKDNEGKSEEEQIREYKEYLVYEAEWNEKCNHCYATMPGITWDEVQEIAGVCKWPGPIGCMSPFRPTGLYETMLKRVMPYTMKGWIYYQGESDDHKPLYYYKLMKLLIKQWRADWNDEEMPFLFVQLTGHRYETAPDLKNWSVIREAQAKIAEEVPNTGMAVIMDAGAFNDIHPKDKVPVADRLYRQAMCKVYGIMNRDEAESPAYESHKVEGDKVIVRFKYASKGLVIKDDGNDAVGFELAGADKVYYPAKAYIEGDKVIVWSDDVKEPVTVRYMWTSYPMNGVNLYSGSGLPVGPFRSNEDDGSDKLEGEVEIQQILELN